MERKTLSELHALELKALYKISGIIDQVLSLEHVLDSIFTILSNTLSMERATVTLKDKKTGLLRICASLGLSEEEKKRGVYQIDEGITGLIFRTAQPFFVPDIGREPLFLNKTQSRNLVKETFSFIGVPILLNGEPIGVISVDRIFGSDVSCDEDIRFLSIVGTIIAQVVKLNNEVEKREQDLRKENQYLREEVSQKYNHFFAVGSSPAMQALKNMIKKVAPSKASVLLLGESGTGKTLTARILHELSDRVRGPFIKVNCAALPDNLIESELFGYEKGAFTGAMTAKAGKLEEADSGTVFLDEIGELPLGVQAKLLHFIQEKEFDRLGSTKTKKVDVRIVAATNVDLEEAVKKGQFRSDLYYRLNVFPMPIPSLKERKSDIPLLVNFFLEKLSNEYGKKLRLASDAMDVMVNYVWPGNVRELENVIERLAIMAEEKVISKASLPGYLFSKPVNVKYLLEKPDSRIEEMERNALIESLERNDWIQTHAARDMGITLRQMGYKLKKYGLDRIVREAKHKKTFFRSYSSEKTSQYKTA